MHIKSSNSSLRACEFLTGEELGPALRRRYHALAFSSQWSRNKVRKTSKLGWELLSRSASSCLISPNTRSAQNCLPDVSVYISTELARSANPQAGTAKTSPLLPHKLSVTAKGASLAQFPGDQQTSPHTSNHLSRRPPARTHCGEAANTLIHPYVSTGIL
ncbi:hypothetical protein HYALB_00003372 [Hymenoscyphus albidus]|uniref:Uncharacterized protein n=1 Tax=Hymenoscyphus albidus TaxID=595503 RepID=A0A9N9LTA1_9HELO|nr:hypothetical protein HYALB_00003372 [Hymenoscyphus albidus]